MSKKYNVIDLFSGAGGLSQGFLQANYNILAGIDYDEPALKTYQYNFPNAKALKEDLYKEQESLKNIANAINGKEIEVVIAGPPCQGFSLTGSRNLEDTRNKLYLAVIHAVKYFQPKAFLIENVPGIATLYNGVIKQQILTSFEELGYTVSVTDKPLLAADYGVPQMRKRLFFVGFKKSLGYKKFEFPKHLLTKETYISTSEAISDLPSLEDNFGNEEMDYSTNPQSDYQKLMRKNSSKIYNHVGTRHTDEVKWVINQVPEGGNHKDLPEGVGTSRKFNEAWTRYHSQKPSKTIDTGHRNHFHYKWNRVPTVRENARLQSFPDRFRFLGTKTQQNRQVGNAVPPLLAQVIADKMLDHLENNKNETNIMKDNTKQLYLNV